MSTTPARDSASGGQVADPQPVADLVIVQVAAGAGPAPDWLVPGALYHHADVFGWAAGRAEWDLAPTGELRDLAREVVGLDGVRVFELRLR